MTKTLQSVTASISTLLSWGNTRCATPIGSTESHISILLCYLLFDSLLEVWQLTSSLKSRSLQAWIPDFAHIDVIIFLHLTQCYLAMIRVNKASALLVLHFSCIMDHLEFPTFLTMTCLQRCIVCISQILWKAWRTITLASQFPISKSVDFVFQNFQCLINILCLICDSM